MATRSVDRFAQASQPLLKSISRTKVEYRQLGASGLRISNPILGGGSIGSSRWLPWVLDEEKALPLLKAAYDRGVNTWDTGNTYSNGESERMIGKAIRQFNIPREKVVIMTKCFRPVCDAEQFDPGEPMVYQHKLADLSKDYVNQWGLSRKAIQKAVEDSLKRLNTNYIDVLHIHRYDPTVTPRETMCALHDLVKAGMVRYLGASSMWTYQFAILQHVAEVNGWTKFVSMQNLYNLLYREEEREMNRFCKLTGVGLIPFAPLAHGRLARQPGQGPTSIRASQGTHGVFYGKQDSSSDMIISRAAEIAKKRDWPMSHVSLAWLNQRVTAPIIGFNSIERIDEALGARGKTLSVEEVKYLEEAYCPVEVEGHS